MLNTKHPKIKEFFIKTGLRKTEGNEEELCRLIDFFVKAELLRLSNMIYIQNITPDHRTEMYNDVECLI
jgi:hypothetical protein